MKNIAKLCGNIWIGLSLILFLGVGGHAFGQRLDYQSQQSVVLSSGLNIVLYKGLNNNNYYFLPPAQSIRLGKKTDGKTPEFLFLKYTTEERESQGGAQGGLLHFLVEWGLTPDQRMELEKKIEDISRGRGKLMGPVDLVANEGESFKIVSATLQDKDLTPTFITSGKAPPMEGGKAAVAARLDKIGAQLFDATLQDTRSIVDVSLVLDYKYTVLVKAAKGRLIYNLDITSTQGDDMAYDFMRKELDNKPKELQKAINYYKYNSKKVSDQCGVSSGMGNMLVAMQAMDMAVGNTSGKGDTGSPWEYGVTETMMRKLYDYFTQNERIILRWEETMDDDRLDVMREAFFGFFLNNFAEPEIPEITSLKDAAAAPDVGMDEKFKNQAQASYSMKSCTQMQSERHIRKDIRLDNIILPVTRSYQMVANIANSYDQVRDNPKCVAAVNLNDPFFQHRDINFIMDLEAEEIFKQEINYATVNVRKRRSAGNDFSDALTIGRDYMRQNGTLATITYARGEDKNPDLYEYKVQWSLKGGKIYPENPRWTKGDWEGVTLAAPIKPRTIEFEADLDEMRELGVTRATLQVRYQKFGKEVEENIPLTVSKNEPLIEHTIYQDREMQGYVYRLVLNHKEHGKLALDWEAKINDDYVYAVIPKELRDNKKEFIAKLVSSARAMMAPGADGTVDPKVAILDKFAGAIELFLKE